MATSMELFAALGKSNDLIAKSIVAIKSTDLLIKELAGVLVGLNGPARNKSSAQDAN